MNQELSKFLVLSCLAVTMVAKGQIIQNGSFETGLTNWSYNAGVSANNASTWLPTSGSFYGELGGGDVAGSQLSQTFPVTGGTGYVLTFDQSVVGDAGRIATVKVTVSTPGAGILAAQTNSVSTAAVSFGQYFSQALTFTVPAGETNATVTFFDTSTSTIASDPLIDTVAVAEVSSTPAIWAQPQNQTIAIGSTANFNVAVTGAAPLSYQWTLATTNINGATAAALSVSNAQPGDAGAYQVIITNSYGSVTSQVATLTLLTAVAINTQPQSQAVLAGTDATFSVVANGDAPTFQWRLNGSSLAGATASSLTITNSQQLNAGNYSVLVSNAVSSATSSNALLTLLTPPTINTQPQSKTAAVGSNVVITVVGSGTGPLAYQWSRSTTNLSGATGSSLTITNAQTSDTGAYQVLITNNYGSATSQVATVTVLTPLVIAAIPQSQTIFAGANATFTVSVNGDLPSYQWSFNGTPLSGATASSLSITNAQLINGGNYSVKVTNAVSSVVSSNAVLTVNEAGQIIQNGSFEAGLTHWIYNQGVTANNAATWLATRGSYYAELGGGNVSGSQMAQTFPVTGGKGYLLTFDQSVTGGSGYVATIKITVSTTTAGILAVQTNSVSTASVSFGQYFPESLAFTVPVGETNATVTFYDTSASSVGSDPLMDNVVVTEQQTPIGAPLPTVTSGTLKLWLRADAGVITNASGQVSQWQDQSFTNHAYQGTTNKQPVLVQNVFNGNPALRFDGIVDATNGDYLQGFGNVPIGTNYTAFLAYSMSTNGSAEKIPALVGTPGVTGGTRGFYSAGYELGFTGWGRDYRSGHPLQTNVFRIWTQRMTNNSKIDLVDYDGQTNRFLASGTVSGLSNPSAGYYIGGLGSQTRNFKGDIAEVIYYQGALTDQDRIAVEDYLAAKYLTASPGIVTQPQSTTLAVGANTSLTVGANGSTPLQYHWSLAGAEIAGATNSSFSITNAQLSNAGSYQVVVSNNYGAITSQVATVTVLVPVNIDGQPQGQSVLVGSDVSFSVSASGDSPKFQWRLNNTSIPGATLSSFNLTNSQTANSGNYSVVVSNAVSSVTSSNALLIVLTPPGIASQPQNKTAAVGSNVTLSVVATGTAPLAYQWTRFAANLEGLTTSSITLSNAQVSDAGDYQVIITNNYGAITSQVASVSILVPVSISAQPQSQSILVGSDATFSVSVSGDSPKYQWRFNNGAIAGATLSSLLITNSQTADAGNYSVTVSNGVSSVTSSNALLTILTPPGVVTQPQSKIAAVGSNVVLNVVASGTAPLVYQWTRFSTNLTGVTTSSMTLSNAQTSSSGDFQVVITNSYGAITSEVATVTILTPVAITTPPQSQTNIVGTNVTFDVAVTGDLPSFQWRFNGISISGATNSTLSIYNAQSTNAGLYSVAVTNAISSVVSSSATLSLLAPPTILTQPQSTAALAGSTVSFSVAVPGIFPQVTSGALRLWLKADAGVIQSNGMVSVWQDQSSGANHAVQIDTNKQPTLVSNALNGNPALRFDGIVDSTLGDYLQGTGNVGVGSDYTGFIVYSMGANGPAEKMPALVGVPGEYYSVRGFYVNNYQMGFTGWGDDYTSGDTLQTNIAHLVMQRMTNANTSIELLDYDGVGTFDTVSGIGGLQMPGAGYYIGGLGYETRNFQGDIAEVIYYQGALTDADAALVQTYLKQKYYTAGSSTPVSYQWFFANTEILGATNASLTLTNVQSTNAGNYYVVVGNTVGTTTSSNAVLTINVPPSISSGPQSQAQNVGGTAIFNVSASGTTPLHYQWLKDSAPFVGATNSTLTLSSLQPSAAGNYQVIVSSSYGAVTSAVAVLTVNVSTISVQSANAAAGTTFVLPINLAALGNENALGFSLNFDPSVLVFSDVSIGAGISGATLFANTNQVGGGKLGLAVSLSSDNTFSAGTQQLVQVTFVVAPVTNAQSTSVNMGDLPTGRQVSDASASNLFSSFLGGSITIAAADFEGDVAPRPDGNHAVTITDWVQVGRFVAGLDTVLSPAEFQRVDCAPRNTLGNGSITITDWVQAGRYAVGLDPLTPVGGPTAPISPKTSSALARTSRTIDLAAVGNGQTNELSAKLVAQGDENALGFSLSFDPAVLHFSSAVLGSSASGATLNINANQAGSGKVGVALSLAFGHTFIAGTQELIKLTFTNVTNANTSTTVSFSDAPVVREVSDVTANSLTASFVGTTFVVNPLPLLTIVKTGDTIVLSWPTAAGDYSVETLSALDEKWNSVTNNVSTNGTAISLSIPVASDAQYYRLKH